MKQYAKLLPVALLTMGLAQGVSAHAVTGVDQSANGLFQMNEVSASGLIAEAGKDAETKCGAGTCGSKDKKGAEAKCAAHKCASKDKEAEAKCAAHKCASKDKEAEAKCAAHKCAAKK